MKHSQQELVEKLITNNLPVLLEGVAGTGKSTILQNAAKSAGVPYTAIVGTRQTTLNMLMGFISINGVYIPSVLRKAYEEGHYFCIDEIDGMDNNVLLVFNSLENDYLSFPDGYSEPPHPNFRFMATANPQNSHHIYTGRSKLDAATLDRFDRVLIPLDEELELNLTDEDTHAQIKLMRGILESNNMSKQLSMRDSIRYYKRKQIGLGDDYHVTLLQDKDCLIAYNEELVKIEEAKPKKQEDCKTVDDLWKAIINEAENTHEELGTTDYEKKMAEEIARAFKKLKDVTVIPEPWSVSSTPTIDDPYGKAIEVYNKETNNTYVFNKEDL